MAESKQPRERQQVIWVGIGNYKGLNTINRDGWKYVDRKCIMDFVERKIHNAAKTTGICYAELKQIEAIVNAEFYCSLFTAFRREQDQMLASSAVVKDIFAKFKLPIVVVEDPVKFAIQLIKSMTPDERKQFDRRLKNLN